MIDRIDRFASWIEGRLPTVRTRYALRVPFGTGSGLNPSFALPARGALAIR